MRTCPICAQPFSRPNWPEQQFCSLACYQEHRRRTVRARRLAHRPMKNVQPILMRDDMVRAILAGHKTQTRRIDKNLIRINEDPIKLALVQKVIQSERTWKFLDDTGQAIYSVPQTWRVNMELWVREKMYGPGPMGTLIRFSADNAVYMRTGESIELCPNQDKSLVPDSLLRPKIFFPQWACRIRLVITDVRIERLHSMTVDDALAEGVDVNQSEYVSETNVQGKPFYAEDYPIPRPLACYAALWDSINFRRHFEPGTPRRRGVRKPCPPPPATCWRRNPFVHVITFERC